MHYFYAILQLKNIKIVCVSGITLLQLTVKKRFNQLINLINAELGLFLSISFAVFLFVLFFEPFPVEKFESNDRIAITAGLSGIVFLLIVLFRTVLPWLVDKPEKDDQEPTLPPYLGSFIILILSSIAFAFYLSYVGGVSITFPIMFRVVFICIAVVVSLRIYDLISELKLQISSLVVEKKITQKQIEKYEEDHLNKNIEFASEAGKENLTIKVSDVVLIKSADNYVEVIYRENEKFNKKLIRNTLKQIEYQIRQYSNFMRCHRICIVNMHYIDNLNRNHNNYWLSVKGLNEQIPVSRQYLVKLKEAL
jgi:hypothetical protein